MYTIYLNIRQLSYLVLKGMDPDLRRVEILPKAIKPLYD